MNKARYITDGKIFFIKVTLVLQDGRTLTGIADTTVADIDSNWYTWLSKAKAKWGSRIDTFQVVQLSKHDPEVKKYMKDNNIHLPSRTPEEKPPDYDELKIPANEEKEINKRSVKHKWQPGKYRT